MKTKSKVSQYVPVRLNVAILLVVGLVLVGGSCVPGLRSAVLADGYQDQINALSAQNSRSQAAIASLQDQAASYQDVINNLQSQINTLLGSIASNKAQQASLQQQITEAQNEIDQQRAFLASDVKAMYVDGTPSTLEVLATSKNLSDFVDKQEYRTSVQNKLQDTLKKIAALQAQLQTQKAQVDALIQQLQTQEAQLASDQAQQQQLLNYNEGQQASYLAQVQANNAQIAEIQRERAAAIAKISGSGGQSAVGSPIHYKNFWTGYSRCGGGYSYCWAGYDQVVSDPWGLGYAHECVHFVADWLSRHGYRVPHFGAGDGNANDWAKYGTVVSNPQVGDVAYMPLAPVGHVGVITAINGDGTYHIEQMNWPVGGYYSEMDLYPQNITFIRFPR
jgi:peptidoglycan hydrolase CwlO-like protein